MTSHPTLAAALAAFQAELPKLRKDEIAKVTGESKSGGRVNYSYGYAGLDQVVEGVLPVLGRNGLSVTSKTVIGEGGSFSLEVKLLHESGENEIGYWPLPDPRRAGPQDIGSAMTYGRRYLTLALTGTFPGGEDDDGAKAQARAQKDEWETARPRAERPTEDPDQAGRVAHQARQEQKPPKTSWTDEEVGKYHTNIETTPIANAVNGYDWMAGKGLHNRAIPLVGDDGIMITATEVLADRLAREAVKPDATIGELKQLRAWADARGLLKQEVSEVETLDDVLIEAELRFQTTATLDSSDNAQQLRQDAAASWTDDGADKDPREDMSPGTYSSQNN